MIHLLRCNSILADSRVLKYISFYKKEGLEYKIIGWDRSNEGVKVEKSILYQKKSGYRVGGFKAAYYRASWMWFVFKTLCHESKVETIHACDLDTVFPAILYKILINRKASVIFDVFDWFSDNLGDQNAIIRAVFKFMEKIATIYSDHILICEPERREQIPYKLKKEPLVLPNIPSFDEFDFLSERKEYKFDNGLYTFAYVGGFIYDRFLMELLLMAEENRINLLIAGYGEENLLKKCVSLQGRANFKYLGKVEYKKGLNIMYNADITYAMYSKTSRNNVFAAPNKYYETMLLGKPIISTKGTILEKKIVQNQIGYVIDEDVDELRKLISSLNKKDLERYGRNAKKLWDNVYKDYVSAFFKNEYSKIIKK